MHVTLNKGLRLMPAYAHIYVSYRRLDRTARPLFSDHQRQYLGLNMMDEQRKPHKVPGRTNTIMHTWLINKQLVQNTLCLKSQDFSVELNVTNH